MTDSTGTKSDSIEYHIKVGTCKDCKWWDAKPGNVNHGGHGYCLNDKLLPPDGGAIYQPDTLLYYDEGSNFWAGPNFGCIHFKPKDNKDGN